jgi:Holliday junction DNA helicase RuvA
MIGMISGTVRGMRGSRVVLDCGGIGYLVAVRSVLDFKINDQVTLYTHLAVRENALDLYGFVLEDELHMFEKLITIPKIGPKTALQILMQTDVPTLRQAILTQDPVYLTKMSGIGKKTAEKIVSELKESFDTDLGTYATVSEDADVIDALLALGYVHKDVREAIAKIPPELTDTKKRITEALRIMSS